MSKAKLGDWFWYVGVDEQDSEMIQAGRNRSDAIDEGVRHFPDTQDFYIIEARMRVSDENAMAAGRLDCAPFEETRNGQWIRRVSRP